MSSTSHRSVTSRRLRVTASFIFLSLAAALSALWAHSYSGKASIGGYRRHYTVSLSSWLGCIDLRETGIGGHMQEAPRRLRFGLVSRSSIDRAAGWGKLRQPTPFTFQLLREFSTAPNGSVAYGRAVTVPHWFAVMLSLAVAIALRPPPRLRFSVRETIAITTVAAMACAGFALLVRAQ